MEVLSSSSTVRLLRRMSRSDFLKTGRQRVSDFTFLKGFFPSRLWNFDGDGPEAGVNPMGLPALLLDVEGWGVVEFRGTAA